MIGPTSTLGDRRHQLLLFFIVFASSIFTGGNFELSGPFLIKDDIFIMISARLDQMITMSISTLVGSVSTG
jgi:hypothetical protein